jgi:hypothetical protein
MTTSWNRSLKGGSNAELVQNSRGRALAHGERRTREGPNWALDPQCFHAHEINRVSQLSPNLSDLPTAPRAPASNELKEGPKPRPLTKHGAGPHSGSFYDRPAKGDGRSRWIRRSSMSTERPLRAPEETFAQLAVGLFGVDLHLSAATGKIGRRLCENAESAIIVEAEQRGLR